VRVESLIRKLAETVVKDGLAEAWARAADVDYLAAAELQETGKVKRHSARGTRPFDQKEAKQEEDKASWAGMRDPSLLETAWPELWLGMSDVAAVLLKARGKSSKLRQLHRCFGPKPQQQFPSARRIRKLRLAVGKVLGLDRKQADAHHPSSPWRYNMVSAVQSLVNDPDRAIATWLEEGAPMGIKRPIDSGHGCFPPYLSSATRSPKDVLDEPQVENHKSFRDRGDFDEPPGHGVIQGHLEQGFGLLFRTKAEAEQHIRSKIAAAPLGCVSKRKEDGTFKHRVILDLKMNAVNTAVTTPERQVLPTAFQHAKDLADLARYRAAAPDPQLRIQTMVLDLQDAFMGIPLHAAEYAFNACQADRPLHRSRPPLYEGEPSTGHFIIWSVLGFGGKPNPLVFSRCVGFACRTAQGLLRPSPGALGARGAGIGRLQTYVDDPTLSTLGTTEENELAIDLVILWWSVLGLPLALKKGLWTEEEHRWIGAIFAVRLTTTGPEAVVTVPPDFAQDLANLLAPLAAPKGHFPAADLDKILGKAGRLAYLIPGAKPFVVALWGAQAGAQEAARQHRQEAPPGQYASARFRRSAAWLRTLLDPPKKSGQHFPLEQVVRTDLPEISPTAWTIQFDASPWGGGAILFKEGAPQEVLTLRWEPATAHHLGTSIGQAAGQTTWEYLTLFLALCTWGKQAARTGVAVYGDNTGALSNALSLKGKGGLNLISRELAWRKIRGRWRYAVAHLPAEGNTLADAVSRIHAPAGADQKAYPEELRAVERACARDPADWWQCG